MKCPACQAKLLPVAGEMFCLQCGRAVAGSASPDEDVPTITETADPILQRAIRDSTVGEVQFVYPAAENVPAESAVVDEPAASTQLSRPLVAAAMGARGDSQQVAVSSIGLALPIGETLHPFNGRHSILKAWLIGLSGMLIFVGLNLAVAGYYAQRVFPGVRIAGKPVGGMSFAQLHTKLPGLLERPKLTVLVDGQRFGLEVSDSQASDLDAIERQVRETGRNFAPPVAGVISSWISGDVQPRYKLSDATVSAALEDIAQAVDRAPADARVIIAGTNALMLAEKPGMRLDQAAAAGVIRSAYGRSATVTVKADRLVPKITTADLSAEYAGAQAVLALGVQVTVRKVKYAPSADILASWVVINGPGKGVQVDPAAVAAYVRTIPGSFDRVATVNAITSGLNNRQSVAYTAATKSATSNPVPVSIATSNPVVEYTFCLGASTDASASQFASVATSALGIGSPWSLGGRIHFVLSEYDCNVRLILANTEAMSSLDPACGNQNSCRIHNNLAILDSSWTQPPQDWSQSAEAYRFELINHVLGQWLGFQHPSCNAPQEQSPILSTPSVVIPGCSPNWYAVPAELQDTKILPGF